MEPMLVDLMMGRGWTWTIPSRMEDSWIHLIGDAMDMGIILVLV